MLRMRPYWIRPPLGWGVKPLSSSIDRTGNLLWLPLTVALAFASPSHSTAAQSPTVPDTIAVTVGSLTIPAMVLRAAF